MAFCIGLVGRVFQAVGSLYAALSSYSTFVSFFRDKIGARKKLHGNFTDIFVRFSSN
jgi:hypothetical protein